MPLNRVVSVTEFRNKIHALLTEVETKHISITITRRGKVVAVMEPAAKEGFKSPAGSWALKGKIVGDIR